DDREHLEFACGLGSFSRGAFYQGIEMFDSGHPCYLMIGDVPVLLYSLHARYNTSQWYHYGSSFNTILFADEIQAVMDELCDENGLPREPLKVFDFAEWPQLENGEFL
ncbi:MAG: hypothetical protein IJ146_03050, partial [Kiritimatiellae bacterium]|nr:hypothetical protein [Kiritimatiellia bacterium]